MLKVVKVTVGVAITVALVMWLMPRFAPASNLASLDSEFKALAIKMTLGRLLVLGSVGLFLWPQLSGLVSRYLSVDISRHQVRALCWYVAAEAAILMSLQGGL